MNLTIYRQHAGKTADRVTPQATLRRGRIGTSKWGNASMRTYAEDPVARFEKVVALTAPASPDLAPDALQPVIERSGDGMAAEAAAVSEHVAKHSRLTVTQVKPALEAALKEKTDPKAKADAASKAVAAATGPGADIELSDPVMLLPGWRALFASLLLVALLGCVGCITALGNESAPQESALISLAVLGGLSLVGILVLVMGYKNVTIKGTGPSASSGTS
jgi:hypothetical protein